jgi:DNA-directed RNA polymerase specialized sigma24 family protein
LAIVHGLPTGLFFLLPPHPSTSPAFAQLTFPLHAGRKHALITRRTLPKQSQPLLTPEQREQVLSRVAAGESYRRIARDFGVSYGAIYRVVRAARSHPTGEEGGR